MNTEPESNPDRDSESKAVGIGSTTCSAPRGQKCPAYGWWLDPLTDCCGEPMVRMDHAAGEYVTWHGYKTDAEPRELRCYRCDKVVWPNGCQARLVRRLAPRTRWTRLPGPPSQGVYPVWENPNGDRVHCGGLLRKADGTCVNWCDPRYRSEMRLAQIMQPSRRRIRALLLWAELILNPTNTSDHQQPKETR